MTLLRGDVLVNADTPVAELALQAAVCVPERASLAEAALGMKDHAVSSVFFGGPPYRILTERDLTRALATGKSPQSPAADAASSHLVAAAPTLRVGRAAASMVRNGIRHLPVVNADGLVIGVLDMEAVFRILLRQADLTMWAADYDGVLADGG
jgi:CBS domain-containing protein